MRKILVLSFLLSAFFPLLTFCGQPWHMESAVFYLEHAGGDLEVVFSVSLPPRRGNGTALPPSVAPSVLGTLYSPKDEVIRDFFWREGKGDRNKTFVFRVPRAEKGIWQFRVTASRGHRIAYDLETRPALETGVMPARCHVPNDDASKISGSFFLVPPDCEGKFKLEVSQCRAKLFDSMRQPAAVVKKGSRKLTLKPDSVYQLELFPENKNWGWSSGSGFPVIYCRSADFAKRLRASRIALADRKFVPFFFQKRVDEWKKTLTRDSLAVPPADLTSLRDDFLADPESAALLGTTGILSAAEFLLSVQNIDPGSSRFGASQYDIGPLAFLYALEKPCNPYYKNKALLNRIVLHYLTQASRLRENGTWQESSFNYAGADAMSMVSGYLAFMLLSGDLSPELRQLWGNAFGYPLRRFYTDRVSCENQSAHWPVKLHLYSKATGNPLFQELAENFIKDLADPEKNRFIRTGYLQEAYGPDATYQGLCCSMLAFYAYFSRDANAVKLVDRIYTLMNHTVAPEASGKIYGASGFSHRTMGGWYIRQYGGGTRLLADKLENAACWHQQETGKWKAGELDRLLKWTRNSAMAYYKKKPNLAFSYTFASFAPVWYSIPRIPVKENAVLPVLASDNFEHVFGNEFYFVRRKSYYTGAYTGKSAGKYGGWFKNPPCAGKWKEKDGVMSSVDRKIFSPLQGMQIFWTPAYGTALLSMNWTLFTHWTARLDGKDFTDWISYPDSASQYDPGKKELILRQKFRKTPLSLTRTAVFGEDRLSIRLRADGNSRGAELIEQFPWLLKPGCRIEFKREGKWTDTPGDAVSAIRWKNTADAGIMLAFSHPCAVGKGKIFSDQGVRIAVCEARTGTPPLDFEYTISSL